LARANWLSYSAHHPYPRTFRYELLYSPRLTYCADHGRASLSRFASCGFRHAARLPYLPRFHVWIARHGLLRCSSGNVPRGRCDLRLMHLDIQHFIYRTNPCGEFVSTCATPSSLNVWIQVPPYVFIAVSEIFASISGLEYAYNKAPARMKSVVQAFYLLMVAFGNAINVRVSCKYVKSFTDKIRSVFRIGCIGTGKFSFPITCSKQSVNTVLYRWLRILNWLAITLASQSRPLLRGAFSTAYSMNVISTVRVLNHQASFH
jgi:hypothetical protein